MRFGNFFKKESIREAIERYKKLEKEDSNYYLLAHKLGEVVLRTKNEQDRKTLFNLVKKWDESIKIPLNIGELIEKNIDDDKNIFGFFPIFDVLPDPVTDEYLIQLFNYGYLTKFYLSLPGDFMFMDDILKAFIFIKSRYKGVKGFALFSFPKQFFSTDGEVREECVNDLYTIVNGSYIIKNKFFLGYIDFVKDNSYYYDNKLFILDKKKKGS